MSSGRAPDAGFDDIFQTVFNHDPAYYQLHSPWVCAEKNADRLRQPDTHIRIVHCNHHAGLMERYRDLLQKLNVPVDWEAAGPNGKDDDKWDATYLRSYQFHAKAFAAEAARTNPAAPAAKP